MVYVTLQFINTELVPHLKFLWWKKKFPQKTEENLKWKECSFKLLGMLENFSGDMGAFIQNAWNSVLFIP